MPCASRGRIGSSTSGSISTWCREGRSCACRRSPMRARASSTRSAHSRGVRCADALMRRSSRRRRARKSRACAERGSPSRILDSHRHAHAMPGIFPVVARVASEVGIRVIRIPREPLGINAMDVAATARKLVLRAALAASHALLLAPPLMATDHFRGIRCRAERTSRGGSSGARHARAREHGAHGASGARGRSARGAGSRTRCPARRSWPS